MARKVFTMERKTEQIIKKIEEAPYKVLKIIGQNLVKEIRPAIPKRSGRLKKSVGYWARRKEKDLQIGFYNPDKKAFAAFYSALFYQKHEDPIKAAVIKNANLIQTLIKKAIDEIGKR